jgi:hypothetical protein
MEFSRYDYTLPDQQNQLIAEYAKKREAEAAAKK